MTYRILVFLLITGLLGCQSDHRYDVDSKARYRADSLAQSQFIQLGNDVYAQKQGYNSFARSLAYYDSAQLIADRWGDRLMQARASYAKGRVYDAWNKDPRLTIHFYGQAADLYHKVPGERYHYLYVKHLQAHAYDKIKDTTNTVRVLTQLTNEIAHTDTAQLRSYRFTAEMALIATEVGDFPLAEAILRKLTRRAWISNDPETYDYLNHYYMTRSRIDALYYRRPSPYIDSLTTVFNRSTNLMDSLYFAGTLADLYAARQDYEPAYRFSAISHRLETKLNQTGALAQMQRALVNSELTVERNKMAYQNRIREIRWYAVWVMGAVLVIISLLSFYLYRRNQLFRAQSNRLATLNGKLDEQIAQIQLLNKEIQHRVKNNLQMIYSLLHMQERNITNPEALIQLQQARLRVESIATLHKQLLGEEGPIDMKQYIDTMTDAVVRCYDKDVVTQLDITDLSLPSDYYLPLALILTEWVTNSMKHAIPANDTLVIAIKLRQELTMVYVDYTDNGLPVAHPVVPNLGMDIVRLLSRQIRGTLTHPQHNPFQYQLLLSHA